MNSFIKHFFNGMFSTAFLVLDRSLQVLTTIIITALIARSVGVVEFGEWQLALTYLFILIILCNVFGFEVIVPLSKQNPQYKYALFNTAIRIRLIAVGIYSLITTGIIAFLFQRHPYASLLFLLLPALLREPFSLIGMLLISEQKVPAYFFASFTSLLTKLMVAFAIYLVIHPTNYYWFLIPLYLENLVFISLLLQKSHEYKRNHRTELPETLKRILYSRSLWGWLFSVTLLLGLRMDRIILSTLLSQKDFGYYAAAAQLNDNWYYLGLILASTLAPLYIYNPNKKKCISRALVVSIICAVGLCSGALFITIFRESIMVLLYGDSFRGASDILGVSIWAAVLLPLDMILSSPLVYEGRIQIQACKGIITVLLVPGLIYLLFPVYAIYSGPAAIGITLGLEIVLTGYFIFSDYFNNR